jgi:hypothetical protein
VLLKERGEPPITERKLGEVLTSLNLTNRTRTNKGWVLWLNREMNAEIHSLARRHGAKASPSSELAAKCDICQAANKTSTNVATHKSFADWYQASANGRFSKRELGERRECAKGKDQKPTWSADKGKRGSKP